MHTSSRVLRSRDVHMPSRPRSHQLETESKREFALVIPSRWVFREANPDYGIDGQIEVFDQDNKATGLMFLVQLTGTDQPDLNDALSIQFKLQTLRICITGRLRAEKAGEGAEGHEGGVGCGGYFPGLPLPVRTRTVRITPTSTPARPATNPSSTTRPRPALPALPSRSDFSSLPEN